MCEPVPARRRQARGERQIVHLLEAAEAVFEQVGYARATTNAIAKQADVSPGTLYQFFPNKEAIAETLALRFVEELDAMHASLAADAGLAALPLEELIDRLVDPFLAFHTRHPALETLFVEAGLQSGPGGRKQVIEENFHQHLTQLLLARRPEWKPAEALWTARMCTAMFKGMMPVISTARPRSRAIRELKLAIRCYLSGVLGGT